MSENIIFTCKTFLSVSGECVLCFKLNMLWNGFSQNTCRWSVCFGACAGQKLQPTGVKEGNIEQRKLVVGGERWGLDGELTWLCTGARLKAQTTFLQVTQLLVEVKFVHINAHYFRYRSNILFVMTWHTLTRQQILILCLVLRLIDREGNCSNCKSNLSPLREGLSVSVISCFLCCGSSIRSLTAPGTQHGNSSETGGNKSLGEGEEGWAIMNVVRAAESRVCKCGHLNKSL